MDAFATVEAVARESYGRLVAYLSARSRDVAGAEDALSEALQTALVVWPRDGVPEKPEAWLLAAARRRLIDEARRTEVRDRHEPVVQQLVEEAMTLQPDEPFPDERLKLLFLCAHPAIDPSVRTPLMLQTVLGLDAARIASAFLVAPAAMAQRLVRAKAKIRLAGIPFVLPEPAEWPARLESVLEAIYAAYGTAWDHTSGTDATLQGLATEAIWLGQVLVRLVPASAEALGLLALMLHCEARRLARRDAAGDYVPLSEQSPALWSMPLMDAAERLLARAAAFQTPGRFQWEAAIQSAHAHRRFTGRTEWDAIVQLYDVLIGCSPTLGALVGRAAALAEARRWPEAAAALEEIPAGAVADYQSYWAVRAHVFAGQGNRAAAREAYTRAIGLSEDEAVRRFLRGRMTMLG
jgi:predicted RNA polymerase sigma factor